MGLIYDVRPTKVFIEELEDTVRYIQYNLQNETAAKNFAKRVYEVLDSLSYLPNRNMNWRFEESEVYSDE